MGEIVAMDLWAQASLSVEQIEHPLVLGQSRLDDVIKQMRLKRRDLKIIQNQYIPGWTLVYANMLTLLGDADGVWQGITYGLLEDALTWQVEAAIAGRAGLDAPDATAGEMPLLLRDRGLQDFAVLPDFIALTAGRGPFGTGGPSWALKGRSYDKWVCLETTLSRASVTAEFLLKVNKVDYETRFEIDYCLCRLSVMTPDCTSIVDHSADPA